jgi:hypothetical protein
MYLHLISIYLHDLFLVLGLQGKKKSDPIQDNLWVLLIHAPWARPPGYVDAGVSVGACGFKLVHIDGRGVTWRAALAVHGMRRPGYDLLPYVRGMTHPETFAFALI